VEEVRNQMCGSDREENLSISWTSWKIENESRNIRELSFSWNVSQMKMVHRKSANDEKENKTQRKDIDMARENMRGVD
jgi:hypothetical protein